MKFLAIECSTDTLSLAASNHLETWLFEGPGGSHSSSVLVPECLRGMAQLDLHFDHLDAILYGKGPGSFTGLRTACSVAQGFAFANQVPTLGFDTLLVLAQSAYQVQPQFSKILCVLDARMGQLYVGAYEKTDQNWRVIKSPCLIDPDAIRSPLAWTHASGSSAFLLACNASSILQAQLKETLLQQAADFEFIQINPRADALIELGRAHHADPSLAVHLQTSGNLPTPLYLRDKVAQTTVERELARAPNPLQTL